VQRQFVDIAASQQHRLTNLLSTIQRDVPPQPSQSYRRVEAESDDDNDDGFYLTSSSKTSNEHLAGISTNTVSDDDDDDDDDDDNWEEKYHGMKSEVGYGSNQGGSAKLPSQGVKDAQQESMDQDFTVSSSDDEDLAEFAASFDVQPEASTSEQSRATMNAVKSERPDLHRVAGGSSSSECSDDSDDELTATAGQQLHGSHGPCKLKVEGIDDVTDFISEFVHQPSALPAETSGNLIININNRN